MKRPCYIVIAVVFALSCSTVKKDVTYKKNDLKNLAADNAKTANQFLDRYDYEKAIMFLNEALKYNKMADNISGIIINYSDIGKVYLLWNKFDRGYENYNTALDIALEESKKHNLKTELAYVYNGIGEADLLLGKYADAEQFFGMALDVERQLANDENQALIKVNLAKIHSINNKPQKALEFLLEAVVILEKLYFNNEIENIKNLPSTYYSIAKKYYDLENYGKALDYAKKAYDVDREIENTGGIAYDYFIYAKIYEKHDLAEAMKHYAKARELYYILDDISQYASVSNSMGRIFFMQDKFKDYYTAKNEAFMVIKDKEKQNALAIASELLAFFDTEEAKTIFSDREKNELKNKFQNYINGY